MFNSSRIAFLVVVLLFGAIAAPVPPQPGTHEHPNLNESPDAGPHKFAAAEHEMAKATWDANASHHPLYSSVIQLHQKKIEWHTHIAEHGKARGQTSQRSTDAANESKAKATQSHDLAVLIGAEKARHAVAEQANRDAVKANHRAIAALESVPGHNVFDHLDTLTYLHRAAAHAGWAANQHAQHVASYHNAPDPHESIKDANESVKIANKMHDRAMALASSKAHHPAHPAHPAHRSP